MRGRDRHDDELAGFVAARNQDLHHDAYQLTAAQEPAEHLVAIVLADMRRDRIDLARAGAEARLRMARIAARHDAPNETSGAPRRFHLLAGLSARQRAVLLLQVIDGYSEHEIARTLHLSARATAETLQSIPYDELPDATPSSGELRSLLEEFGDLATPPTAGMTLADVDSVPPPPRRPWWTYVAAILVVALTVTTLVVTQGWHDDWLRSAAGLNHTHGTHFPAYTHGYKLVDIHDVEPGPPSEFSVRGRGAVTLDCTTLGAGLGMSISSESDGGAYFSRSCSATDPQQLMPASGRTSVSINDFSRDSWPVAVYREVGWHDYPAATGDFVVAHGQTFDGLRRQSDDHGRRIAPLTAGSVLTMRAPSHRPNGTFTRELDIPASAGPTELDITGLLSPTTTGRFRIRLNGKAPWINCASMNITRNTSHPDTWCALYDRDIPQVDFSVVDPASATAHNRRITVEVTVQHASGPWTLQVVADRYKSDASAVDDGANK